LCAGLGVYSLSALWGSTQTGFAARQELWQSIPATADADLLQATLDDLSTWQTGRTDSAEITLAINSPALRWLLRDHVQVALAPEDRASTPGSSPAVLITTPDLQNPELDSFYRGQDFIWRAAPGWQGALPPDFLYWLAFRQAPVQQELVILWARSDLFSDGAFIPPESRPLPEDIDPALEDIVE
jgi:hypothetical protein